MLGGVMENGSESFKKQMDNRGIKVSIRKLETYVLNLMQILCLKPNIKRFGLRIDRIGDALGISLRHVNDR